MLQTDAYARCNHNVETTLNCQRECEFSIHFQKSIGFSDPILFQKDSLYDWIRHDIDGGSILLDVCWWLWCAMNKLCIADEVVSSYTLKLITVNYVNMLAKYFLKNILSHPTRTIMENAHKGSNMILNVNVSSLGDPDISDFRGFIQNVHGVWVHDFASNIGYSNTLHVELMALYHGLCMAWELGIKDLICYSDFNSAINLISESVNI